MHGGIGLYIYIPIYIKISPVACSWLALSALVRSCLKLFWRRWSNTCSSARGQHPQLHRLCYLFGRCRYRLLHVCGDLLLGVDAPACSWPLSCRCDETVPLGIVPMHMSSLRLCEEPMAAACQFLLALIALSLLAERCVGQYGLISFCTSW